MQRQQGLSLGVFFSWAIIGVIIVWIGFQTVPAYMEYRGIMGIVRTITVDSQGNPESPEFSSVPAIQARFTRQADLGYITSLKADELEITKEGGRVIIEFEYEKRIKLIGNAYLLLVFSGHSRT